MDIKLVAFILLTANGGMTKIFLDKLSAQMTFKLNLISKFRKPASSAQMAGFLVFENLIVEKGGEKYK